MAMEIRRVLSRSLALEDWVEVGGKVRFDGKVCRVTKIEAEGENYKVYMTDAGYTTYDALGLERPLFAVNAVPVLDGKVYEVVLTDVTAVESEEVEEEAAEEPVEGEG